MHPRPIRTAFLSDFHMGYKGFDAVAAKDFIDNHDFDILYLVGDIIDGWKLEKRWYWNDDYTALVDTIIDKLKEGKKICYTPGNHDEKMRDTFAMILRPFLKMRYGVRIDDHFTHITKDGKKYIVIHGDQFDSRLVRGTSKIADRLYSWLAERSIISPRTEKTIIHGERQRWSLGKDIAKNGSSLLKRFTDAAVLRVIEDHADGIIYGHSHVPMLETNDNKIIANCGSWTRKETETDKHHTAIIEKTDGSLEMLKWPMMHREKNHPARACLRPKDIVSRHKETKELAKLIHDIWCKPSYIPQLAVTSL